MSSYRGAKLPNDVLVSSARKPELIGYIAKRFHEAFPTGNWNAVTLGAHVRVIKANVHDLKFEAARLATGGDVRTSPLLPVNGPTLVDRDRDDKSDEPTVAPAPADDGLSPDDEAEMAAVSASLAAGLPTTPKESPVSTAPAHDPRPVPPPVEREPQPAKPTAIGPTSIFGLPIIRTSEAGRRPQLNVLVHGPSGAGKTHLAKTTGDLEHTLVVAAEPGLLTLRDVDLPVVDAGTLDALKRVFRFLREQDHGFRWVIIDSISEVAEAILSEEKRTSRDGRKAYGETSERVLALIKAYRDLPLNVVMLAKQERTQDDNGRMLYGPMMPGRKLAQQLPYLFDEVLALRAEPGEPDDTGRPTITRFVQTATDHVYEAKDRSGALALYERPHLAYLAERILGTNSMEQAA